MSLIEDRGRGSGNDSKNFLELHQTIEKLRADLQIKEIENEDLQRIVKNHEAYQINLKFQLKSAEDDR